MISLTGIIEISLYFASNTQDATPKTTIISGPEDAIVLRNNNKDLMCPPIIWHLLLRSSLAREKEEGLVCRNRGTAG